MNKNHFIFLFFLMILIYTIVYSPDYLFNTLHTVLFLELITFDDV